MRGFRRAALRFLIIAVVFIHCVLTGNLAFSQEPAAEQPAEKPSIEFLKPLINVELAFVKRVCEPTDEQMTEIVAAANNAYQRMGDVIGNPRAHLNILDRSHELFLSPNQERLFVNPFLRVRKDVERFLKPLVSTKQYSRYIEESDAREKFEREAAIAIVLELLNDKLHLSQDQQEKLHEEFMFGMNFPDLNSMKIYIENPQSLPNINGYAIEHILNETQKPIWRSHSRATYAQCLQTSNTNGFTEEWLK